MKKKLLYSVLSVICVFLFFACSKADEKVYTHTSYAMSTVIVQTAYGDHAEDAMTSVAARMLALEKEFSLFDAKSEIAEINAKAGEGYVQVSPEVFDLLRQSKLYSAQSNGAFRVTIAPLTLAWGITTDSPRVVEQPEREALLQLVNDEDILLDEDNTSIMLRRKGQALDLGGIAKGWACKEAERIYNEYGVTSAVLSIGGNVYVKGSKPNGQSFSIGFRDPEGDEQSYIASFLLKDQVIAVSGGYERYFEQNGVKYQHILNPATGAPTVSDIASVGIISNDGAYADFMSTTLYVWGAQKTCEYMKNHPEDQIILLDNNNFLYVSKALKGNFTLKSDNTKQYTVVYL